MDVRYEDWLRQAVPTEVTFRTKLSELRRIERTYGDLDNLYDQDEMSSVVDELTYSKEDVRQNRKNPSKLVIDGDLYNNLSSYKAAVNKYIRFRTEIEMTALAGSTASEDANGPSNERSNWRSEQTFSLEKDLQQALRSNISQIESGLTIADGGAEMKVPSGFIDILATDRDGAYVVIELKATKARREAVGQILAYMGDIQMLHPETTVRGLLIAPEFEDRVLSAARVSTNLSLHEYGFQFQFSVVG
jgi:hypothetical protein